MNCLLNQEFVKGLNYLISSLKLTLLVHLLKLTLLVHFLHKIIRIVPRTLVPVILN